MAQQEISELFDESRFPSGLSSLLCLVLYFPFGLLLCLLRVFIGLQTYLLAWLLPKRNVVRSVALRVLCAVLGIVVRVKDRQLRDPGVKIMVANYTSTLDHLAVDLVFPSLLPCVWDLPPSLMWLLGYVDMGVKGGRDQLISNSQRHCQESNIPLLIFPEGASTNGKTGLLKFSVWAFSLEQPLQPVVIKIHRPFIARLSPSILGGRWWHDVFWYLFVPYTLFTIRVLSVERPVEGEGVKDMTRRVQSKMAAVLGVHVTAHTSADKVEFAKRRLFAQRTAATAATSPAPGPRPSAADQELERLIGQVQEVLPDASRAAIAASLALTKDVDLTISSLLEGVGTGPAEGGSSPTPTPAPVAQRTESPVPVKSSTAASSFSRQASGRQMSLQQRKQALIEHARQQYLVKHGLT